MRLETIILLTFAMASGVCSFCLREAGATGDGILATRHNLSVSGPGPIKAVSEERVCIFCHTPHHATQITPLWSRPEISGIYTLYSSSTRAAKPGQPTGPSRLCLSCHDGTIAVGALADGSSIAMVGGFTTIPIDRPSNLGGISGKNLSDDHPISFEYSNDLTTKDRQLRLPSQISPKLKLDPQKNIQCTTCHDPHTDPYGNFLVMDNTNSGLCIQCHIIDGWSGSRHATEAAIAAKGCGNCHVPHNAKIAPRLLKQSPEEANCLSCHAPAGPGIDILTPISVSLSAQYVHPVTAYFGVHDPTENPLSAQKHVECEDCHNPHQVQGTTAAAPMANGALAGVSGVSVTDEFKQAANYEYEVCYKCHGDNNFSTSGVARQLNTLNQRLNFDITNPSFHPVAGANTQADGQSLRLDLGYSVSSIVYCTDCHGSDRSAKAGGTGANGPHGSAYRYLLLKNYVTDVYPVPYSDGNYALCYRCHDQNKLFGTTSPFLEVSKNLPLHDLHVRQRSIPCFICHDPHGISRTNGGTDKANAHLINFVRQFGISGSYDSQAPIKNCSVSCHATNPRSYGLGS